ncbi:MAG: sulfite oxidase-like oxidoreductase [Nitrospinota bacterium]|nr:sulfite oxidase-like oxidoreductase [Nitrospinota bacterium]MDH5678652.1 sulfite oxidase-like oxidoreductase [Nitrospinota bacterium]MDH5757009.1 sulfite oxidase-like oxidoreductase [Nitrospinota bacterium]
MKDEKPRLPPGQILTEKFPVLHYGEVPEFDSTNWDFRIFGLVEQEVALDFDEFSQLPSQRIEADFHCVTTWSRYDNLWEGVLARTLAALARPLPGARHVLIHCEQGYTTNLSLEDFLRDNVLFALKWGGKKLTPEHGYPLRLVVPHLYAWKSAKWARGVEFMEDNRRGFWESRGYHNNGDPWREERFSSQEQD